MPDFINYEVEYTNVKPWNNQNLGSGKMIVSIPVGSSSIKAKLKRTIERKINSLGVRIDSFKEVAPSA
ncbi:MAG: hypothetical protein J6W16_01940 [Methanobrevibacter sp.]|nr:hypothetical protein [Methanobrevibacter sp.]